VTVTVSEWWIFVSDAVDLRCVGFECKGAAHEYAFTVRGTDGAFSERLVTLANDAFLAHHARYQDAPEICSLRLDRKFAAGSAPLPSARFSVTEAEPADGKDARAPKSNRSASAHRGQEF
jgi:hypothetical protein